MQYLFEEQADRGDPTLQWGDLQLLVYSSCQI
jgi:hypothetical protein